MIVFSLPLVDDVTIPVLDPEFLLQGERHFRGPEQSDRSHFRFSLDDRGLIGDEVVPEGDLLQFVESSVAFVFGQDPRNLHLGLL